MKINGKKSSVVCINGAMKEKTWNFGVCEIGEVEEYKYLCVNGDSMFEWWFIKYGRHNGGCKRSICYGKICSCKVGK